jgi:hypothetical protein
MEMDLIQLLKQCKSYIIFNCNNVRIKKTISAIKKDRKNLFVVIDCNDPLFQKANELLTQLPPLLFSSEIELMQYKVYCRLKRLLKIDKNKVIPLINSLILKNPELRPQLQELKPYFLDPPKTSQLEAILEDKIKSAEVAGESARLLEECKIVNTMLACIIEKEVKRTYPNIHDDYENCIDYDTFLACNTLQDLKKWDYHLNCSSMLSRITYSISFLLKTHLVFDNIESLENPIVKRELKKLFNSNHSNTFITIFSNGDIAQLNDLVGYPREIDYKCIWISQQNMGHDNRQKKLSF